jgi:hypothetical protein
LSVHDPVKHLISVSPALPYPMAGNKYDAASLMESIIQRMIIPAEEEMNSCGAQNTTKCSNAVKVWPVANDAFAVFFLGERLGEDMGLTLNTDELEGFAEEMFLNSTNDRIRQNSDICYSNLKLLDISTGNLDHVVENVWGKDLRGSVL